MPPAGTPRRTSGDGLFSFFLDPAEIRGAPFSSIVSRFSCLSLGVHYNSLYKDIRDAEHYTWLVNEAERQCFQQMGTLFLCKKQQSAALLLALPSRKLRRRAT